MIENIFFDISKLKYCGKNVIIGKTVRIRNPGEVSIGDGTIIDDFTYISCAMTIGKNCHIASNVSISGGLGHFKMGDFSTLSNHCSVHCATSDYKKISLDLPSVEKKDRFGGDVGNIEIGDYVVVGAHSTIMPHVKLPNYSAFGAYSLIKNKKYKEHFLYAGIPAKEVSKRKMC